MVTGMSKRAMVHGIHKRHCHRMPAWSCPSLFIRCAFEGRESKFLKRLGMHENRLWDCWLTDLTVLARMVCAGTDMFFYAAGVGLLGDQTVCMVLIDRLL